MLLSHCDSQDKFFIFLSWIIWLKAKKILKKFNESSQFITKIENLDFDLLGIQLQNYFYWIQMRVFGYLYCKLKVNGDIKFI